MHGVYLSECGTHALVGASFWPYATSERVGGSALLRSLTPDMLVMWDRGFHDYDFLCAVRRAPCAVRRAPARGADPGALARPRQAGVGRHAA